MLVNLASNLCLIVCGFALSHSLTKKINGLGQSVFQFHIEYLILGLMATLCILIAIPVKKDGKAGAQ